MFQLSFQHLVLFKYSQRLDLVLSFYQSFFAVLYRYTMSVTQLDKKREPFDILWLSEQRSKETPS